MSRQPPLVFHAPGDAPLVRSLKLRAELDVRARPHEVTYAERGYVLVAQPEALDGITYYAGPITVAIDPSFARHDYASIVLTQRVAWQVNDPRRVCDGVRLL